MWLAFKWTPGRREDKILLVVRNGVDAINDTRHRTIDHDEHFHNNEKWFGAGATLNGLTGYTVTSGNADFGSEVLLIDTGDTPIVAGKLKFDMHYLLPLSLSSATVYYLKFIYGTGTVAAAESAGDFTVIPVISTGIGALVDGLPTDIRIPRLDVGTKVWAKTKNATNLATIEIAVGIHEYDD